jgi:polysaccharide biosynthesis protein PelC
MKRPSMAVLTGLLLLLAGCVTVHQGASEPVTLSADWVILPFINNTETPYAAERAESITSALLYSRGVKNLVSAPVEGKEDDISVGRKDDRRKAALDWARKGKFRYALAGTVNEWRYKVGLDGEPVVGVTLQVLELPEGKVLWSATGAKSGWSRDAVSAVAQQVIDKLLGTMSIK